MKRKNLWMMSVQRVYGSGIWIWMLSISMRHLTVCRCITVEICMIRSEDSEEYDPLEMARAAYVEDYNFDVPEGMELMTYNRRRPDGG